MTYKPDYVPGIVLVLPDSSDMSQKINDRDLENEYIDLSVRKQAMEIGAKLLDEEHNPECSYILSVPEGMEEEVIAYMERCPEVGMAFRQDAKKDKCYELAERLKHFPSEFYDAMETIENPEWEVRRVLTDARRTLDDLFELYES